MTITKENIDWEHLGFGYRPTKSRFQAKWKEGSWYEKGLVTDPEVTLSEAACVFHYAQCCFEGLKAYTTQDGHIVTFRPDLNAERMIHTCDRLMMPALPKEDFLAALDAMVTDNASFVPPFGTGASLYIRPVMIGSGPQIGVAPANEFLFRMFCMPVGAYFKGAVKPLKLRVSDFDRAAPHGTGNIKAGLNYAMSLYPTMKAHEEGYAENVYLDPATRTMVEETGGANLIFVRDGNTLVVPKSESILPSITRRSLVYVAEHYLGMKIEERPVPLAELSEMQEGALCGTAAVLAPIGTIHTTTGEINMPSGMDKMGPVATKLRETLTGIQMGTIEAPEGWVRRIM